MNLPPSPASAADLMDAVTAQLAPGAELVVPIANGEPRHLLDELEARADGLDGVRVHQMHALHDRPYLHGAHQGRLDHVAWFLSSVTRGPFHAGNL